MPVGSPEGRTVEVLALPPSVDEELLSLYFENKRRSGGGPLVSVEKKADRATLVFEEAEAADRVLSKGHHVLHNAELSVRRPASKGRCRLLLRGINPSTCTEMIELYVENMMHLNMPEYSLHPSPARDFICIHLSQPLTKDFQDLSAKIAKRKLDGAEVTLEQVDPTDSVFVENLPPGTSPDVLTQYFESLRGGGQKVKEATMLSDSTARVSFLSYESLDVILDLSHRLDEADLVVAPYFDFLLPTETLTPRDSAAGSQDATERDSEEVPMQTGPPVVVDADGESSSALASKPPAAHAAAAAADKEVVMTKEKELPSSHIPIGDPAKLALFKVSGFLRDTVNAHPTVTVQVKDDGVHIAAADGQTLALIQRATWDYFGQIAETRFTLESEQAQLLARSDVREHLLRALAQAGPPAAYAVSDCSVVVTAMSQDFVEQACSFLKSQLCHLSIPVDAQYECMLYCREWSEFLQTLAFSTVKVSERGGCVDLFTLKGMEGERQAAIVAFLATPIERETVICMEPGVLKYIQMHCHQLLAEMDQVSIFPLEAEDVYGLKIHGQATACQMAEEVLQGVVSSVCTRTITVNVPGVARFLKEEFCVSILKEMERKFTVLIIPQHVPWEKPANQDIFDAAWDMMSHKNLRRASLAGSSPDVKSDSMQTDHNGTPDKGLLEQAKRMVSAVQEGLKQVVTGFHQPDVMDELDLYTADDPTPLTDQDPPGMAVDDSRLSAEGDTTSGSLLLNDGARCLSSNLEEEAQMSLAIQYSMESSHWSPEEQQLQQALELSKNMSRRKASSSADSQVVKGVDVSLQEAIKAANTMQLVVYASYNSDLIRVDIAFGKKVHQRQVEERLEHRCLRNVSEYHRKCLEMIKRKHAVEIQIQGTIVTVSGFKDYVAAGVSDLKLLLEKMSTSVTDREILKTVQWVYQDPAFSDPTPYSAEATVFIENAMKRRLPKVDILLENQPHTIDFEKMQECNVASGSSVKISRKPSDLGDLESDVTEEEYSLLSTLPEATKIDEESDEFQNVVKDFYASIQEYHSKIRIIKVEKLMNRLLYNQYMLKKASVLQRATYPEVERTLYHGTSESSVKEICVHGFNRSFAGKNATVYGQGVYFAVNSALSVQEQYSPPSADGYKYVFVSKVLTGDYTTGDHTMITAPLKETDGIPLRYDSVTNDITRPSMFVIFNDTQAFPEYLITCQRISR